MGNMMGADKALAPGRGKDVKNYGLDALHILHAANEAVLGQRRVGRGQTWG